MLASSWAKCLSSRADRDAVSVFRHVARGFGAELPDEGGLRVVFDDSIITDTFQEKKQDLAEVGVTMSVTEFRWKWYSESEAVARGRRRRCFPKLMRQGFLPMAVR